ncbi:hypothetical protein J7E71_19200 [Mesobacillus foraminis]|uniref:hypothetical protein n=1 Tax=Mesobacillus foraminis TaxID=279826 RepID=UPI001BE60A49|nr:hypothetical protein [Mesobacillus foraminis]MBT2758001.1 hypothetical protein [Mesobacillus foraminis]
MQGILKKGAKVTGTAIILRNPLTWIIAGILFSLASVFAAGLFLSVSLGSESQPEGGLSREGDGGTARVSANVLGYEPFYEPLIR